MKRQKLNFDQLAQEIELMDNMEGLKIKGGMTAAEMLNDIAQNGIGNYAEGNYDFSGGADAMFSNISFDGGGGSGSGAGGDGGGYGFGTGSNPIQLNTVTITANPSNSSTGAFTAITIGMDSYGTSMTGANALNFVANGEAIGGVAFKALTSSGTVIGMIAGGGPAVYHIINGDATADDWIALGLAALAGASEFTGLGEAYDGTVGVGIAVGTLGYDAYQATQQ
ncbi:hypothetical protein [Pedobacter sp. R-06]|uniref:hypothetical protein n=1 Tax=Pedobacter sp. R-06 TaxID=3404051 RepID=UPI003CF014E0